MIALALAKTGQGAGLSVLVDPATGQVVPSAAQAAFPLMVRDVLPTGVRGIVVAGLLAALMSSLAGVFNACSTLFTIDFYAKFRPGATQAQLVWIGRVATTVMVLIGLAWIPVIQGARGLYEYLQGVSAYIGPPIFTVFFFGVFMKRLNGAGRARGAARRVGDGAVPAGRRHAGQPRARGYEHGYPPGSLLWIVNNIYFQYLEPADLRRVGGDDDRRQLRHGGAVGGADPGPDVRHGDAGAEGRDAPQLEPLGRDQLGHRARADPHRLRLLQRLAAFARCGFGAGAQRRGAGGVIGFIHDGAPVALILRA